MLPKKGFTYKCKMNFNQYVKDEIYKCVQDGYLEVNGLNYRIQDENFFEGYFSIHKTLVDRLNFGDLNISNDASIMYPKGRVNRNNPIELIKQTGLTADEVENFYINLIDWVKKSYSKNHENVIYNNLKDVDTSKHPFKFKLYNKENEVINSFEVNPDDVLEMCEGLRDFKIEPLTTFSKNLTKDKIVLQVMEDLNSRSRVGIEKYNTTLERTDLELKDWLQHAYEECLDQANYLKRAIIEIENKQS